MRKLIAISAMLVAATCTTAALADQAPTPQRYSLKALDSSFATPYSYKIATNSAIPFDKTYSQLSDREKRLIR